MKKQNTNKICEFVSDLHKLCIKYDMYPAGNLRIRHGAEWDKETFSVNTANELDYGYAMDRTGPFLVMGISKVEMAQPQKMRKNNSIYVNSDYMPGGAMSAVKSMADGKMYDSKSTYRKELKARGYDEVGDQAPTRASEEIRGDFECRKELQEAFKQHLG